MTEPQPEPTPEITAQDLVNAIVNVTTLVLPAIQAQAAQVVAAVDQLADIVDRLNAVEHRMRTGRKPMPAPIPRPAKDPR